MSARRSAATGTPASTSNCRSKSLTLYLKNGQAAPGITIETAG